MTEPFTPERAVAYVRAAAELAPLFDPEQPLSAQQISEGNVNLLFKISQSGRKPVLLKQALPHSWRYPDFKMPVSRQQIEHDVLEIEARYVPGRVPQVHAYDPEHHVLVIEFLSEHVMMRDGLMQQQRYPLVAEHIGIFTARSLFYTSDLYLASGEKKVLVERFTNAVLRKVQEDLVFTEPFIDHPNNRWTRLLDQQAAAIRSDDELRAEAFALKAAYMTQAQALLHNDLHTGSIMLNPEDTRVIDPEFAFFGPIGHDVGSYLANLAISYASQEYHAPDAQSRDSYRDWLLGSFTQTWQVFEAEFRRLWENEGNQEWPSPSFRERYIRQLLRDSAGFAATEVIRRTIGMAHVQDFWRIEDEATRASAESLALNAAVAWLRQRQRIASIDDLATLLADARAA